MNIYEIISILAADALGVMLSYYSVAVKGLIVCLVLYVVSSVTGTLSYTHDKKCAPERPAVTKPMV